MVLSRKKNITNKVVIRNKNIFNDNNIDNSFFNQIINMFFKYGLKLKKVIILRYCLLISNWHKLKTDPVDSIEYINGYLNNLIVSDFVTKWKNSFSDFFLNLNNLSLMIKQDGTNRQIRKYSKGKFKYRSRVLTIGDTDITNFLLRFWRIIIFSIDSDEIQLDKFFFNTLVNINLSDYNNLRFNPLEAQLNLLDNYFKKKIQ